ncbi:MAG: rod shape-determining protein MreC [Pseudomonadota bacterium]
MPRALQTAAVGICTGLIFVSAASQADLDSARLQASRVAAPIAWLYQIPLETIATIIDVGKSYLFVRSENVALQKQMQELDGLRRTVEQLSDENAAYRRQLAAVSWPSQVVATGRVLSHGGGTYTKSVLLAAGSSAGIAEGYAVVSSAGLVGQVVAVAPLLSRVLLVNDFSSRVPVVVDSTATPGIAEGTNAQRLKLDFLPIDFSGSQGARISTSGSGGLFPAGLPLGRLIVEQVAGKSAYFIEPFADLTATGVLTVLKPADAALPQTGELPTQLINPNLNAARDVPNP